MELIPTIDGARILGISPRTLYELIDAHRLTVYTTGRGVRLDLDEVRNYDQGLDGFDDQPGDREPRHPLPSPMNGAAALALPRVAPPRDPDDSRRGG